MGLIALENVKPGMVLADDAFAGANMLLSKGSTITEKHIKIFQSWGLVEADIEGVSEEEITNNMTELADPEKLNRAMSELKTIFLLCDLTYPPMKTIFKLCVMRKVRLYGG